MDDGVAAGHRLRDGGLVGGAPDRRKRARALIVGGGVAGLSAAWRMARAGVDDIQLVELCSSVGGTSRGGEMALAGGGSIGCPFGAHYLPLPRADQRALAAFLTEAGIARGVGQGGRLIVDDRLLVRDPAERVAGLGFFEEGLWLRAGATAEDHSDLARFEAIIDGLVARDGDGRRLFDLPLSASSPDLHSLDGQTAEAWCSAQGFERERIRWYLEYATRDDFGARLSDTSAWAFLHYFAARADLATKESPPFMTWPEGNQRLVAELRRLANAEVHTGEAAASVRALDSGGGEVETVDLASGRRTLWAADTVIVATPQFVTRRVLAGDPAAAARAGFRYGPWLVANVHLKARPSERGFPAAWDSVIHGSDSLGYVDASHQLDRGHERDTVWTWYLPVTDSDERGARGRLLGLSWDEVRDAVLADLRQVHPDIDDVVTRVDAWRWGHGMVKPTPGLMWGGARSAAAASVGDVHFAHSDLSGIALFEEAQWQGTRGGEAGLASLGLDYEALA